MKEVLLSIMVIQWAIGLFTLALNSSSDFDPRYDANLTKRQFQDWMLIPVYPFILLTIKAYKRLP